MTTQHLSNVFCKKNRLREMTIFCKFWRTWTTSSVFCLSFWNWTPRLHIEVEKIFNIIGEDKKYFNSNLSQIYYLSWNCKACGYHMLLHTYANVDTWAYSLSDFSLHTFDFFPRTLSLKCLRGQALTQFTKSRNTNSRRKQEMSSVTRWRSREKGRVDNIYCFLSQNTAT